MQENVLPRKQNLWKVISSAVLILAVVTLGVLLWNAHLTRQRQTELEDYRNEALQQLMDQRGEYDESRIVLADTSESAAKALAEKLNATLRITEDGHFAALTLPEGITILDVYGSDEYLKDLPRMSADYQVKTSEWTDPGEEISGEHLPARPQYTVTDSDYNLQTYLNYLDMKNVWSTTLGKDVTVAVIDTGIDTDHPEFAGRISEYSYNATEDKIVKDYLLADGSYDWSLVEDEQGHGTAVAGVIGASMNNSAVVGVAPEVTLLVIKAECDENGMFKRSSDLVFGLYYAIERDVAVINMSFGTYGLNPFANATKLAYDSDIICIAAAGNDGTAAPCYPAADEYVFGVGALEEDGWGLATYSNYGENTDLVAPGTVYTTKTGGKYGTMSGTSFASPITSGVLALYLSQNKYQEFNIVQELLYASCYDLGDLGSDWYFGYGALDVSALMLEERGTVTFNMLTDELENTKQVFIRNHTLQNIPEPERLYAVFDGWYYDPQCTDEFDWYADEFISDLTLYANWVNEEDGIPYTYVELEDGTIEIRSYTGHRRYITIPDYIDGKVVSSIGVGAFAGQTRLREVNLPKYLVRIRDRAFSGCSNLLNIAVPDKVTEIGESALDGNVRLSYVAFGSNSQLKSVGSFAFSGCVRLTRFELPATLVSVDGSAFYGAASMTAFAVREGNTAFTAKDGVLFNNTSSTLICYPAGLTGAYSVPTTVRCIGNYAFALARIGQIDLAGVESIGENAFVYSSLEEITIPDTVKNMGVSAFFCNYSLKSVTLGSGLASLSDKAFACCNALKIIEIPAHIQTIGSGAFEYTVSMTEVNFAPDSSLVQIGGSAFAVSGLQTVEIPSSVIAIGDEAFLKNFMLSSVTFGDNSNLQMIGESAFAYDANLIAIQLPEHLSQIGSYAFQETGLNTITIPSAVTTLGAGAFASCHSLTEIKVEKGNANYLDLNGVVYDRSVTTLIAYPAGNTNDAYTVAEGVSAIGKSAFYGSWNLNTATLSSKVDTVDEYAFFDCRNIRSYMLCEALTYIKQYAFASNTSLSSMSIPDNVMQISNYAFAGDRSLSSVTFTENSKLPRISFGAFAYCGLTSFKVPANVSTMAQGAFAGCTYLTSFTFAKNSRLESISAYMFDGCDNLRTITFEPGSALTSIQAHGLEGLRKLTSIDFGDAKLTNIDNFAFRFCESLTGFTIPNGVTSLGRYAFYYCTNLQTVNIPQSVEFIGRFAFLGTKNINVYFTAETLPLYLAEDWDHGVTGYYLGVTDVLTDGDWQCAKLTDGNISILKYTGSETSLDLTVLDFGGKIVNIGGEAFAYSVVENVRLPESTVTIQAKAFYHSELKSITIPASVEFIGREAFADTPIQTLTFADNAKLSVMEQSAFENTKQLTAVTLPASLKQTGRAIFKNSGIRTLNFADGFGLTEISEEAFAYTNITSLNLPDSVTTLNQGAFRSTASLETVVFGIGTDLTVNSNVFYHSGLKTLEIPVNMTYIGEYAFVGLSELTEFRVAENNPNYKAVDGLLVSKDGRKLIAAPAGRTGNLTVPAGIEVIGFGAFEDSKLSKVLFLDDANILSFGYRAFFGMKNLTEIEIPASMVAIDYYAFANCTALEKVTFAEDNLLCGVYEGAFYGCKNLCNITLSDSVVEISDFAFYGCRRLTKLPVSDTSGLKGIYSYGMAYTGLTELTLPETVIDLDGYAFKGAKLKSVTVPDTNALQLIIGIGAFEDCKELREITLPFIGASFEDDGITWFGYIFGAGGYEANSTYVPESLKKVTITADISFIGEGAFSGLGSLEEISVPHSVTTLYFDAFNGTTAKYELTNTITTRFLGSYTAEGRYFGKGISGHLQLSDSVTSIFHSAFENCSNLTSITIGNGVTSIGWNAFRNCSNLKSITIGNSVTSIDDYAFEYCRSLESIMIPDSVTSIGNYVFRNCSSLTSVKIPDSVTSIGSSVFSGCSNLTSVTIPDSVTSIGGGTFWDCCNLKSITIPDSVTSIGNSAFSGCSNLTSIDIPEGVTNIGGFAFLNCSSLTSIDIPEGVTSIGEYAFNGCRSLTSVTIPDSVTSIGNYVFENCSNLTSIHIPEGVTSIGNSAFNGCSSLTSIHIPKGVTSIGNSAFNGCSDLKSITIPESVTSIGSHAFRDCSSLTSITIPDGVTSIGDIAFQNCRSLTSITIPNSVTSIGVSAFSGCSGLYIVYNNSDLELTIGSLDYGYIAYNAKLIVDKNGNKMYRSGITELEYMDTADGFRFVKENGAYKLIAYLGTEDTVTLPSDISGNSYTIYKMSGVRNVILPDGITSIGSSAFYGCSSLTSIRIPEGVTSIGDSAFYGCSSLTSITIPDSVTSIGNFAFCGCNNLTSVTIGSGLNSLGSGAFAYCSITDMKISDANANFTYIDGLLYDKNVTSVKCAMGGVKAVCIPASVTNIAGAFEGNTEISLITFAAGSKLASISSSAFQNCSSLESITIPDCVTSIGSSAFYGCSSLTSITIPDSVTSIGNYAFQNCSSLTGITIPDSVTSISSSAFYGCSSLTSIHIPEGVTSIGSDAFCKCINLTSVTIPDSVTSIGSSAFSGCSDLKSITIPESVTIIGNYAFQNCSSLTSITIPDSVTSIGNYAFQNCSSLTSITIPYGVTSIGYSAFNGCSSLTSITIPDSVTNIDGSAFSNCSNLTSVAIGNSVTSIGQCAFQYCSSLTSITIPYGVTRIGDHAFYYCDSLTSITIPDSVTRIDYYAFSSCYRLTGVYITDVAAWCNISFGDPEANPLLDAHNLYLNGELVADLVIPDGVAIIGNYAFQNCSSLTSVKIPDSVTSIGNQAFSGCGNLTSVTIPDSVTSIGSFAFSGCSNLTSINIPESVTSIGNYVFGNCSSLTSIHIPEGVTSIGSSAFYGCSSLTSVKIPDSVTSIGNQAFSDCRSLYAIYNNSDLELTIGGSDYGYIAYNARLIADKNGNKTYREEDSGLEYIDTVDGFLFEENNGSYILIAYIGSEGTVTLPADINGNRYTINTMRGIRNVILPDGVTSINSYAFWNCSSLKSITIPDGVTIIGEYAFYNCSSLKSITIPESVTSIGDYAFYNCSSLKSIPIPDGVKSIGGSAFYRCRSLTSITIPDSVTSIGSSAFDGTAYYNDPDNWENGALFIGNHLIRLSEDTTHAVLRDGAIAYGAFTNCYKLKKLTIGGNHSRMLSSVTNLETLVITELPTSHSIYEYFGWSISNIPITLKNIVLTDSVRMRSSAFSGITGVTIYVASNEKDVRWDENFPGWNNGNKAVYGDKWITADFFDGNGNLLSSEIFTTSQVIRQPYVAIADDERYNYELVGWDLDGDGMADTVPATSTVNISARPIFAAQERMYAVNFYDKDGTTVLYSYLLPYGSIVPLPVSPTKAGYTFLGWNGFTDGMTVTGDIAIHSIWSHIGAHVCDEIVWVVPTCTEQGYNKHICPVCGEWYGTDYVDAIGHSYTVTAVPSTCTERGYDLHTCIHCGESYRDNYTKATGHTFGEWIVDIAPTCADQGLRHHICSSCKVSENETVSASGHSYKPQVLKEATCTEHGEILYTCELCGALSYEHTEMTAHNYQKKEASKFWLQILIEKVLNVLFGYEGNNAFYYECVDCHHIQVRDEATMLSAASAQSTCDHILGEWTEIHPETYLAGNVEVRTCSACGQNVEYRCGVKTGDHCISISDVTLLLDSLADSTNVPDGGESTFDVDGDGAVSISDVMVLLDMLASVGA